MGKYDFVGVGLAPTRFSDVQGNRKDCPYKKTAQNRFKFGREHTINFFQLPPACLFKIMIPLYSFLSYHYSRNLVIMHLLPVI